MLANIHNKTHSRKKKKKTYIKTFPPNFLHLKILLEVQRKEATRPLKMRSPVRQNGFHFVRRNEGEKKKTSLSIFITLSCVTHGLLLTPKQTQDSCWRGGYLAGLYTDIPGAFILTACHTKHGHQGGKAMTIYISTPWVQTDTLTNTLEVTDQHRSRPLQSEASGREKCKAFAMTHNRESKRSF